MRILVSGSSGLIGSALVFALERSGHAVTRLVRRAPRGRGEIEWDPARGILPIRGLEGIDGVVHLAGESIASGRWSASRKTRIRESRVRGTELLAGSLARLDRPPAVMVSASAIGYYGNRGDEPLTESSPPGSGVLSELTVAWERATAPAAARGVRVVLTRTGMVLTPSGGALARLLPLFRLGLGGPIGRGDAWWSWITLDDLVGVFIDALTCDRLSGPLNVVAPAAVTNGEFTRALARALKRPALVAVPPLALRILFGEMADEVLLASARAMPAKLEQAGFAFRHRELEPALSEILGRKDVTCATDASHR
jgi:hypothetical protein